jgi:hypothetical protein
MTMTWTLMLKDLTPNEFTDRYRLTIEQFYSLLQRILAKRPKYRGRAGALDCRLKLASCLRYLAGESFFATTNHGADGAGPAAGAEKIGRGRVNTGNLFGGLAPSSQRHYSEHCCRMVNDDALLC